MESSCSSFETSCGLIIGTQTLNERSTYDFLKSSVDTHPQDRCPHFVREQGLLVLRHFRRDEAQDALRYGLRLGPGAQRLGRLLGDRDGRILKQLVLDVAGIGFGLLDLQEEPEDWFFCFAVKAIRDFWAIAMVAFLNSSFSMCPESASGSSAYKK